MMLGRAAGLVVLGLVGGCAFGNGIGTGVARSTEPVEGQDVSASMTSYYLDGYPSLGPVETITGLAAGRRTVYRAGVGKAFILGYRLGPTTFEWHFSQSYRMSPSDSVLQGQATEGSLGLSTVGIRYGRQRRSYVLSGFFGVTRSSMPLLSLITEGGETTVARRDLVGVGGVGGLGFAIPIRRGQVQVGLELRAAYAVWERPGAPYVAEVEPAGDDTVTYSEATDDVDAIPWTLAFALRALL